MYVSNLVFGFRADSFMQLVSYSSRTAVRRDHGLSIPLNSVSQLIICTVVLMPTVYSSDACHLASTHALALLFTVFALAMLFDLDQSPYAVEAQEYYLLSRLCLRFAPPINDITLMAIQSMVGPPILLEGNLT